MLRPYQVEAVEGSIRALREHGSALGVAATGMGKTVIFAHVIQRWLGEFGGRAMVIAHREELIYQARDKIEAVTGMGVEVEMAEQRADHGIWRVPVVVASKDTLHERRLSRFKKDDFRLIVTDEAHHAVADSYRRIYRHFEGVPHLGVTATPDRADEQALGQVFAEVAFDFDIQYGVGQSWLVPIEAEAVDVKGLDYSRVRTTAGDLNGKDLADVMSAEEVLQQVTEATMQIAQWRRTLVFAPPGFGGRGNDSFRVSERLVEIFNRRRPGCARLVSQDTPGDERKRTLEEYADDQFQFLVNVGIFTEGFDDPGVECVSMARATESRSLYAQMIGRGTRTLPHVLADAGLWNDPAGRAAAIAVSPKASVLVIDFVGNSGRHSLVTAMDILGGERSDEAIAAAKAKRGRVNVAEVLDDAERELAERREAERRARIEEANRAAERRRRIVGETDYDTRRVDVFGVLNVEPRRGRQWDAGKPPTPPQLSALRKFRIPVTESMNRAEASRLLSAVFRRLDAGLCTPAMGVILAKRGYDPDVSMEEAKSIIDKIAAREGWKPRKAVPA